MAVVEKLIRAEKTGELSFGNYKLAEKAKLDDFKVGGDLYKVKTCKEITKLEKNGLFVYESVPGTTAIGFLETGDGVKFTVSGDEDAQITLGSEDGAKYDVMINGEDAGVIETNLGGKLTLSVELNEDSDVAVIVKRK